MYLLFNLYSDDALLKTDQSILFKNKKVSFSSISPAPSTHFSRKCFGNWEALQGCSLSTNALLRSNDEFLIDSHQYQW